MSRTTRALLVLAGLLALLNASLPDEGRELSGSSFGSVPQGHRALFELLTRLDLTRGRSLSALRDWPAGATIWWVEPMGLCDARIAMQGEVDVLDPAAVVWGGRDWVEAGGTAVVFLEPPDTAAVVCDAVAGIALPGRSPLESGRGDPDSAAGEGVGSSEVPSAPEGRAAQVDGPRLPLARRIPAAGVTVFDGALDWRVAAWLRRPGSARGPRPETSGPGAAERGVAGQGAAPFALERDLGEGRLVVVADAGFLRNARLDALDAAPLALDLVRAYGAPYLDEREHGFVPESSAARYLVRSAALPVFLGLALLGALVAWRGSAWPARRVAEFDPETPTLETFVDSMATLYARTGDHRRVLERYRELTLARLGRHFGMSPAASPRAVLERVERSVRSGAGAVGGLACLRESRPGASATRTSSQAPVGSRPNGRAR